METVDQHYRSIPIEQLQESASNPRRHFEPTSLAELVASIQKSGIIVPILVRPITGKKAGDLACSYEIVAGARRYRAGIEAKLAEIPAIVREMTDEEVLEAQIVENLQRQDVHPLEEAEGYHRLIKAHYTVEHIAERVGRSIKYVYDRVKLLNLTKDLQKHFLEGRITAGHAILLARLKAEDQDRLAEYDDYNGSLWTHQQHLLDDPDDDTWGEDGDDLKPVSVRELQSIIDKRVRFDDATVDPMLFPETHSTLEARDVEKVIHITHERKVPAEARGEGRTLCETSWKRADGRKGSKTCEFSVTGVVVVGFGRGEAFKVCTNKKHCKTHWGDEIKDRIAREKEVAKTGKTGAEARELLEQKKRDEEAKREAEEARWNKAVPLILTAIAEKIKKAPAGTASALGQLLLERRNLYGEVEKQAKLVPPGKTAEDLVRHLAFVNILETCDDWGAEDELPKRAKAFGVDAKKILADVAAAEKPKAAKAEKAAAKKGKKKRAA